MASEMEELVVNLSQEELLFLLNGLGAKTAAGIAQDIFDGVSEEAIGAAVGAAQRALIARGFLIPKEDASFDYHPALMALVGLMVYPQWLVFLESESKDGLRAAYWYAGQHLLVEHTPFLPGIHKLRALNREEGLLGRMVRFLPELNQEDLGLSWRVAADAYRQAVDAIRTETDSAAAASALEAGGMDGPSAKVLAGALTEADWSVRIGFQRSAGGPAEPCGAGLVLIASAPGAYLITVPADASTLLIQSASAGTVEQALADQLQALQNG